MVAVLQLPLPKESPEPYSVKEAFKAPPEEPPPEPGFVVGEDLAVVAVVGLAPPPVGCETGRLNVDQADLPFPLGTHCE